MTKVKIIDFRTGRVRDVEVLWQDDTELLVEFYDSGERCRSLVQKASLPTPERLAQAEWRELLETARTLINGSGHSAETLRAVIAVFAGASDRPAGPAGGEAESDG